MPGVCLKRSQMAPALAFAACRGGAMCGPFGTRPSPSGRAGPLGVGVAIARPRSPPPPSFPSLWLSLAFPLVIGPYISWSRYVEPQCCPWLVYSAGLVEEGDLLVGKGGALDDAARDAGTVVGVHNEGLALDGKRLQKGGMGSMERG